MGSRFQTHKIAGVAQPQPSASNGSFQSAVRQETLIRDYGFANDKRSRGADIQHFKFAQLPCARMLGRKLLCPPTFTPRVKATSVIGRQFFGNVCDRLARFWGLPG